MAQQQCGGDSRGRKTQRGWDWSAGCPVKDFILEPTRSEGSNPTFQAGQWQYLIWSAREKILVGMNMSGSKFLLENTDLVVAKTPS